MMGLYDDIKSGKIKPAEALEKFETPGRKLFDITPSGMKSSLPIGFSTAEHYSYVSANQPHLIVLAARPGHGKSALLFQMAFNVAKTGPVDLYSLEMDAGEVKARIISQQSGMTMDQFRYLDFDEQQRVLERLDVDMVIDDTAGLHINQLVARSRARAKNGLKAIFVDYLQIVGATGSRSKAEEIGATAQALKTMAKELQIPVICAAQMNRNMDGRLHTAKDPRLVLPYMSDISDSAGIEKWADVLMFLHPEYVGKVASQHDMLVTVAKNRHGPKRDFRLRFDGAATKFTDRGPVEDSL